MSSPIVDRIGGYRASLAYKAPCITAASTNITLTGLQTIAGVTVADGERVLAYGQTDPRENGIWTASSTAWSRAKDWNGAGDVTKATRVAVASGSNRGVYVVTTSGAIAVGTTAVGFVRENPPPSGDYSAGTTYAYGNTVLYQGSTWFYINDTAGAGNAPPSLPATSNAYWQLLAQRGDVAVDAMIATLADAALLDLSGVNSVLVARYGSSSMLAPAAYKRVASEPSHTMKFQDATGAWFEIAETMITPGMCGAPETYLDDASAAVQRQIDFVRASYNPTSGQFAATADMAGRMWVIETSINATNIRQAGMRITNGGLYGKCTARAILDLSGTQGVRCDLNFYGDKTSQPMCAVLLCKAVGVFGSVGLHDLEEVEITGWYSRAALINYGAEVVRYPRRRVWNNVKTTGRATIIITGESDYLVKWMGAGAGAGGSAVISDYMTLSSGSVSCINHLFTTFDIRRFSSWGALSISSISKASPGVVTLASATTEIADGDATYFHGVVGMTELNSNTYFLKRLTDTTYELYTDGTLTTPLDTSGFTTFTSGLLWAATGPALILAGGAKQISRATGYFLTYGGDAVIVDSEYTINEINDIDMSFQHEALPQRSIRYVSPASGTVTHHNHRWQVLNANQDWRDAFIGGQQVGTGKVRLRYCSIDVPKWLTAPSFGLFSGASVFEPVQCDIRMPDAKTKFNANAFNARFSGSVVDYTTDTRRIYEDPLTYTPELKFGGASTGITYSARAGWYERRGETVIAYFRFALTSKGSATGNASVSLPVQANATANFDGVSAISRYLNMSSLSAISGEVLAGSQDVTFYVHGAANSTAVTDANFTNTSLIRGMAIYRGVA